ncbi:MAG: insulinase family protein [Phycisphaerales bacterium]|nr:insulinase family protein [Phycisphaerales bacterium]
MPVEYRETTLENGLRIVAEVDARAHTAAAGFFVKTGACDEDKRIMGVSHFLEHMIFKGTERRSADDVNREFDDIGASHNAFTAHELTVFYAHVLPEYLQRGVDILADILRPAIRQADFDAEKSVILEEIAMYRDQPFFVLYEDAMERYYGDHPMSHRVLGTDDTVTDMQRDEMQAYFDHRYSADNTVISLAGRLDFKKVVQQIAGLCGSWTRTGATRRYDGAPHHSGVHHVVDERINRAYSLMLAPAPPAQDDRRYAAAMLTRVLGESEGSRLYWALVETGLAEAAEAHYEGRDGLGDYLIFAATTPDRADEVWSIVEHEIGKLVDSLTEDDLVRLRNKMLTGVTVQSERPAGRMQRLGRRITYFDEYATLEEELDRINAVTLGDLRELYEAFPFQPRTVVHLAPST